MKPHPSQAHKIKGADLFNCLPAENKSPSFRVKVTPAKAVAQTLRGLWMIPRRANASAAQKRREQIFRRPLQPVNVQKLEARGATHGENAGGIRIELQNEFASSPDRSAPHKKCPIYRAFFMGRYVSLTCRPLSAEGCHWSRHRHWSCRRPAVCRPCSTRTRSIHSYWARPAER